MGDEHLTVKPISLVIPPSDQWSLQNGKTYADDTMDDEKAYVARIWVGTARSLIFLKKKTEVLSLI